MKLKLKAMRELSVCDCLSGDYMMVLMAKRRNERHHKQPKE